MKIRDLLSALGHETTGTLPEKADDEAAGLFIDSKQVVPGSVFVAIRGTKTDAHTLLSEVVQKNPAALVVEDANAIPTTYSGLIIKVKNTREALDLLASQYYEDPSAKLLMFGVTGTNGKTSCTYMIEQIFNSVGFPTGVIGTINHHLLDKIWPASTTTPGPLELQERLSQMRQAGAKVVAMEVSSHALAQHRADSVHFNSVLFTNLTQDHLDYHKSMEDYFKSKQRLFTDLLWKSRKVPQFAIINIDDKYGRKMRVAGFVGLWTYGQKKGADFQFKVLSSHFDRTEFELFSPFGEIKATIPLCGIHNVYNTVGVLAAVASLGIPIQQSLNTLATFQGVPGRLQAVANQKDLHVFVDYAHTPDALENVLRSLVKIRTEQKNKNKIITVFGCGGDRDKGKRPMMAQISENYSDHIVVTSDNPRTEDPGSIIGDILRGFLKKKPAVEADRKKAIALALSEARPGDVVLIAGKGHEDYQQIGSEKIYFSDYNVAKEILS